MSGPTVTEELTALVLSRPGPEAPVGEVAAWHEAKAAMLDHAVAEAGPDVNEPAQQWARELARAARARAAWLREGTALLAVGRRCAGGAR